MSKVKLMTRVEYDQHDESADICTFDESDAMRLAICVASGLFDDQVKRWLQSAFVRLLRLDGSVPLERLLRIAKASKKLNLARRNLCLIEAAKQIECTSAWLGAVALANELDAFLSRGAWLAWKDLSEPPTGTSHLRTALFHFAKSNGGNSLSAKHVYRIAGHVFQSKCH